MNKGVEKVGGVEQRGWRKWVELNKGSGESGWS